MTNLKVDSSRTYNPYRRVAKVEEYQTYRPARWEGIEPGKAMPRSLFRAAMRALATGRFV